jgi:YD repeat-containing protein
MVLQVLVGGRPDGTQQTTLIGTDGKQTITQPDGISQTVSVTGDPRFGLQSPIPTSLNVSTLGGQNGALTNSRTATLSDPNNPLSLTSQTDTVNFNGRTATRTYNATTRTATDTSPAGRTRTTVTDPQGRVTQQQHGTLAPTAFSYDVRGRLASRSQGGRSAAMSYDSLGRLGTITDSASRTVQFQYDAAGRVTQQTLPGVMKIGDRRAGLLARQIPMVFLSGAGSGLPPRADVGWQ